MVSVKVGVLGFPTAAEEADGVSANTAIRKKHAKGRAILARPLAVLMPDLLMSSDPVGVN
jgi:hypothetical protein